MYILYITSIIRHKTKIILWNYTWWNIFRIYRWKLIFKNISVSIYIRFINFKFFLNYNFFKFFKLMDEIIPVKVAVRIRPMVELEILNGANESIHVIPNTNQVYAGKDKS